MIYISVDIGSHSIKIVVTQKGYKVFVYDSNTMDYKLSMKK